MRVLLAYILMMQSGVVCCAASSDVPGKSSKKKVDVLVRIFERKAFNPLLKSVQGRLLGTEPASQQFQDLEHEAQKKLVHPIDRVPLYWMGKDCPVAAVGAALSTPIGIFLNKDKVEKRAYGAQRSLLFHESVHTKYHDLTKMTITGLSAFLISSSLVQFMFSRYCSDPKVTYPMSLFCGCVVGAKTVRKYQKCMERRADLEGHNATQCAQCVKESADQRYQDFVVNNNALKDSGYLQPEQLYALAKTLQVKGLLCTWHQQHTEDTSGIEDTGSAEIAHS